MTMHYTTASEHVQENRMRLYPTQVINIIGGPGCDKTLYSAAIILNLNLRHKTVEFLPDYAKTLVWHRDFEALKNQYQIAQRQNEMLEVLDGQVQFLVTECSLPQMLHYNAHYPDNICDIAKTRLKILEWHQQHHNVNVLAQRGDKKYVQAGRFQSEDEARQIDQSIQRLMDTEGIPYTVVAPDFETITAFANTLN
ncbi:MAG: hypothetical protein KA173_01890 [Rhodoferax sp.]|nr:hypothetical protein [Rhodoferax sp.]